MGKAIKNRIFRIWGNSRLVKQNDRCIYLIAVRHFTDKFITIDCLCRSNQL